MIASIRGCITHNNFWSRALSPRLFSHDYETKLLKFGNLSHIQFWMDSFHIWHKWSLASDAVSHVMILTLQEVHQEYRHSGMIHCQVCYHYTPAQRSWRGGILDSPCPSVCPSVRPSVCRRHGFRSISQVCFGISISNFICMLMVAIGRSLLIFSDITFKMAAWRPYWIFWFPDSHFILALNINFKLKWHNTYVYV